MGNEGNMDDQNFSNGLKKDSLDNEDVQKDNGFIDPNYLKELGVDTQTFEILRNEDYLYTILSDILSMIKFIKF